MTHARQDFWSRRKAKVAAEAAMDAEVEAQPDPEMSDAEVLESLQLPDPETLSLGDDIKGFMSKAVPDHLRRKALRRLWRLNPVLANLDGLVDYDDDFTDKAVVKDGMKTAYQVGKGMLAHIQEMVAQTEAGDVIGDQEMTAGATVEDMPDEPAAAPADAALSEPLPEAEMPQPRFQPRRMRFSYADQAQQVTPT